jgi:hypothetical protein
MSNEGFRKINTHRVDGVAQVIEYLSYTREALEFKPQSYQKKKKSYKHIHKKKKCCKREEKLLTVSDCFWGCANVKRKILCISVLLLYFDYFLFWGGVLGFELLAKQALYHCQSFFVCWVFLR